jgi:hypothetical protein
MTVVEAETRAAALEAAEAAAWADLIAACPSEHARRIGLEARWLGRVLVQTCPGGGFDRGHFNRPIGLGVVEPATRDTIDELIAGFRRAGVARFMFVEQPECRPAGYRQWLVEARLRPNGSWQRVARGSAPFAELPAAYDRDISVEQVRDETVEEWTALIAGVYGLDCEPWLRALLGRPGWRHYLAREAGRLVAARSCYVPPGGGLAFVGIDAPVPGVMTTDYEPDARLCETIVADGLANGASGFIADIEAPSAAHDTPAYEYFGGLGFDLPYTMTHYMAV